MSMCADCKHCFGYGMWVCNYKNQAVDAILGSINNPALKKFFVDPYDVCDNYKKKVKRKCELCGEANYEQRSKCSYGEPIINVEGHYLCYSCTQNIRHSMCEYDRYRIPLIKWNIKQAIQDHIHITQKPVEKAERKVIKKHKKFADDKCNIVLKMKY